ncbi:MAG: adenylate/guanylate cyclase domain-containing protein [Candidatus Omnitrophota bacterium]
MIKHKTLTIVFADVQGYTSRTGQQTREQNELFQKEIQAFVKKQVQSKDGTLVKTMGDGFLLAFDSPTDAVNCGLQIQKDIAKRNANILDHDKFIRFSIGMYTGEVTVDEHNDVHGDAVNIAARIQSFAKANDVYIGESTYLAMNKSELNAQDLGLKNFKNVVHDVRVYKVVEGETDLKSLNKKKLIKKIALISAICVFGVIFFLLFNLNRQDRSEEIETSKNYAANKALQQQKLDRLVEFVDSYERNGEYEEAIQALGKYISKETDKDLKDQAMIRLKVLERRKIEEREKKEREKHQDQESQNSLSSQSKEGSIQREKDIEQLLNEGNYDQVINLVEQELLKNSNNFQLFILAGEAYLKKGEYPRAEKYLQNAIDLNPNDPVAYQKLSIVYEQSDHIQDAILTLNKGLRITLKEHQRKKFHQQISRLERRL